MTNIDHNQLARLRSYNENRPDRVLGIWPATRGKAASAARQLIEAKNNHGHDRSDILMSGSAPRLKAEQVAARDAAYYPKLDDAAQTLAAEKSEAKRLLQTVGTLTYADHTVSASQVHLDLERLRRLDALRPAERAAVISEVATAAALKWDLAESLIRLPRDLSCIDVETHSAIRISLWRVQYQDEFDMLDARMAEIDFLQRAISEVGATLADEGVPMNQIATNCPATMQAVQDKTRLAWPNARRALAVDV